MSPLTNVHSKWDSGELVFHEADDHGVGAEVLRIATDAVTVGSTTNDVDFKWYGTGSVSFILDVSDSSMTLTGCNVSVDGDIEITTDDIALDRTYYIYFDGLGGTENIRSAADGYLDLEAATAIRPGIDLLTDRWQASVTNTLIGMGVVGASTLGATAEHNTAFGYQALYSITTADNSVAFGSGALYSLTTAASNCAFGISALRSTTTGTGNVAVGSQALYDNVTGCANCAVGYSALQASTGHQNNAFGGNALTVCTGAGNNAFGYNALLLNTSGAGNIAIGWSAGDNITSADYCIIIGYDIDAPSATVDGGLQIGRNANGQGRILGDNSGDMEMNALDAHSAILAVADIAIITCTSTAATFAQNPVPTTTNTETLGTSSLVWGDLFLGNAGVIDFNSDVTITHASNLLTVAGGNLRMGTTDRLELCDAGTFLYSPSSGTVTLAVVPAGVSETEIQLAGNVYIGGYLLLQNTHVDGTVKGQIWYDHTDDVFQGREELAVKTFANLQDAQTFEDHQMMDTDKKLKFRNNNTFIYSPSAGILTIALLTAGTYWNEIQLSGNTYIGGYLILQNTNTDGDRDGQMWYSHTNDQFRGRANSATVNFIDSSGGTLTGLLTTTSTTGFLSNPTFDPNSTYSNYVLACGTNAGAITVNFADAANENFNPIQLNFNLTGTGSGGAHPSQMNTIYSKITHTDTAMAGLRLKCADFSITANKAVRDMYAYQGEITCTGSMAIAGEACVMGLVFNAGSAAITGGVRGLKVSMGGNGMPSTNSAGISIDTATNADIYNGLFIETQTGTSMHNGIWLNTGSGTTVTRGLYIHGSGTFTTGIEIGAACTTGLTIGACTTGISCAAPIYLKDDVKLYFGDDSDFSIYWTGGAGGWLNIVAGTGGGVSFYAPGGLKTTAPVTVNNTVTVAALLTAGAIACNGNAGIAGTLTAGALACNGNGSVAGVLTAGEVQCNGNMAVAGTLGVAAYVIITNIPTADPNVAGELWDDNHVITRSWG